VGNTPPGPDAASRPLVEFPYSNPEPWSWIPGTWIQPGTIFVTAEGRFYRLVERMDDGWKAENVAPAIVGPQSRITNIKELKSRYDEVLAAHDELDIRMKNGEDTPESRSLLRERDAEMHRLRDRLILLCNGRSVEARAATAQPDRWQWPLVAALAVAFVLAAASCIRRLYLFVPGDAGKMIAGAVFFLAAAALAIVGIRELAKHRNRLVTGNLVGCYTLAVVGLAVAAFVVMFVSVVMLYTGAYE
jgi:cation transport ATPase